MHMHTWAEEWNSMSRSMSTYTHNVCDIFWVGSRILVRSLTKTIDTFQSPPPPHTDRCVWTLFASVFCGKARFDLSANTTDRGASRQQIYLYKEKFNVCVGGRSV